MWQSLFLSPTPPRFIKKLEHSWKALVYDGVSGSALGTRRFLIQPVCLCFHTINIPPVRPQDSVSVHRPGFYASRFLKFMSTRVFRKNQRKYRKISPWKRLEWKCREVLLFNYDVGNKISGDLWYLFSCVAPLTHPLQAFFCFVFCSPLSSPGLLLCKRLKAHDPLCSEMCTLITFVPLSNTLNFEMRDLEAVCA